MARIPFKIDYRPQIESGEYKVVTDCGESVEIVKWNCKGECPILAVIDDGDVEDTCFFNEDGISPHGTGSLYVITTEPELTEFEEAYLRIVHKISPNCVFPEFYTQNDVKKNCDELLDIARNQISKEKKEEYNRIALGVYSNKELTDFQRLLGGCIMEAQCSVIDPIVHAVKWSDALLEEALKDMPRWKPAARAYLGDKLPRIDYSLDRIVVKIGDFANYLNINDLYKLPKEE